MSDGRGRLYDTADGGQTWTYRTTFSLLNDIAYDGADTWYIAGRHIVFRLGITPSDNDGIAFAGDLSFTFEAISFPTPEVGYALNVGGKVFKTVDGGETWSSPFVGYPTSSHPGANFMRDIDMLDKNIGGVVGTHDVVGATDSGGGGFAIVLSTANEDENFNELPQKITLGQNYPNPFNPTTTITFDLAKQEQVRLEVFDLLGRKVATVVDGMKTAGSHQVRFDATNLSSGMYLYRLSAGDVSEVRRMVLSR